MPSLKDIRLRIKSVQTTMQTTKAMKMVAASKLRRAQDANSNMRPYSQQLQSLMNRLVANVGTAVDSPYMGQKAEQSALCVVITSNRGLCGAFNANVNKMALQYIQQDLEPWYKAGKVQVLCVGKKGFDFFNRQPNIAVIENRNFDLFASLQYDQVNKVAEMILNGYINGEWDRVVLFYNHFKNVITQIRTTEQLLPLQLQAPADGPSANAAAGSDYIYEPDQATILQQLIPKMLKVQFYSSILDSNVSEHGARMVAMDSATENANSLIKELKLTFNKARQAAITKEILEIVGGAEALSG
jgi:F-type H+-transporting ATPase subunit gamma